MNKYAREVMLEAALEAAARQALIAELKAHPDLKNCPNIPLVADEIIYRFHYGPNQETGAFQVHYDEERRYPSVRQLPEIIPSMKDSPETAHLFRPATPKWERPEKNPWLKLYWNLTAQGQVFRHDPELAQKWMAEAKRQEHALRRMSNA